MTHSKNITPKNVSYVQPKVCYSFLLLLKEPFTEHEVKFDWTVF